MLEKSQETITLTSQRKNESVLTREREEIMASQ